MQLSRRQWLSALSTVGATAVAGCSGGGGGGGGGGTPTQTSSDGSGTGGTTTTANPSGISIQSTMLVPGADPDYADLIPASWSHAVFTSFDLKTAEGHSLTTAPDQPSDPLRFNSAYGSVSASVVGSYLTGASKLGFASQHLPFAEKATHYVGINGVGGALLPVDLSGLKSAVKSEGLTVEVDKKDRIVFVGSNGDVFGATSGVFLAAPGDAGEGFDAVGRVTSMVDARVGATARMKDEDGNFATLLSQGDVGGSVLCAYSPDGTVGDLVGNVSVPSTIAPFRATADGIAAAKGAFFHLDPDNGEDTQSASGTMVYPSQDAIDAKELAKLGTAATQRSFLKSGTTVVAEGRYTWESLSAFEGSG